MSFGRRIYWIWEEEAARRRRTMPGLILDRILSGTVAGVVPEADAEAEGEATKTRLVISEGVLELRIPLGQLPIPSWEVLAERVRRLRRQRRWICWPMCSRPRRSPRREAAALMPLARSVLGTAQVVQVWGCSKVPAPNRQAKISCHHS